MHDSSSIEAFKTTKSQLEKQNLNFDQEYRKKTLNLKYKY